MNVSCEPSAYRYELHRGGWLGGTGELCWVMLNPSTADETSDDPTIRRVVRFTRDAGYARLVVVNLFAARATNPKALLSLADPVGPRNDYETCASVSSSNAVVLAWGALHRRLRWRADWAQEAVREMTDAPALCLGKTMHGDPRHPLYVPASQRFEIA
jgi:hypothetical protein